MCSAHCVSSVFFNWFWQNQFRSTIFNSFTSLMHFSLLEAIYSVVFAFLSPFLKNIQEVEQWNVDLVSHSNSRCLVFEKQCWVGELCWRSVTVSGNKGLKSYSTLWHLNQLPFQITLIFCSPIFSQFYWPSYSAKEYLEDHGQCLTCCYLHELYLEAKPSKCKKYRTLLHFLGKMKCEEL